MSEEPAVSTKVRKKSTKKASPRPRTTDKLTALEIKFAEFQRTLELLQKQTSEKEDDAPPKQPEVISPFGLSERLAWVTKNDMPTVPEIRRVLWAGVKGTQAPEDEELSILVRELTAARGCLLCGADSHASMSPPTPWNKVRLCKCALMRVKEDPHVALKQGRAPRAAKRSPASKEFVEVMPGWLKARNAEDGGISWLMSGLEDQSISPMAVVYRKTCRCDAVFPIYAGMIARVIRDHELERYVESNKCLPCARTAAEWRAKNNAPAEPHHVVPRKAKKRLDLAPLPSVIVDEELLEQAV